jgi:hypothetical protein
MRLSGLGLHPVHDNGDNGSCQRNAKGGDTGAAVIPIVTIHHEHFDRVAGTRQWVERPVARNFVLSIEDVLVKRSSPTMLWKAV